VKRSLTGSHGTRRIDISTRRLASGRAVDLYRRNLLAIDAHAFAFDDE
jgi:hypothetical protein